MKILLLLLLAAQAKPAPPQRTALNLFASAGAVLGANRVACGVDNVGNVCVAFASSPIQGGAFWPKGTSDYYIFNSGLQLAALIPAGAGFAWAGDTIGAFFFDPRGDQSHGSPRSDVFNSRDSADAVNWPTGAVIRDATTFDARLVGRNFASEQDLWTRYWEGSPHLLGGRPHPMGVLVDQRLLAWNYPTGNQDIFYVVVTLYNVTARTTGVYANPTIPPELQSEIAAAGREFQDSAEQAFAMSIPDGGYALDSMYVQLGMDADIAIFDHNYSTAIVPFGLSAAYSGDFRPEVGWTLPADPFGAAPFAAAPGLVGTTFLKAPAPFLVFTNLTGGGAFPDAVGTSLLWRRMSANLRPSDTQCNIGDMAVVRARHVCYLGQTRADTRFSMSAGPFRLDPGEATTVVLAYVFAPPLDTANAYVGGDLAPGIPFPGDSIAADTTKIRVIERIAGWRTQSDANGNGVIEANEVVAARRSFLHKAQVAQAIVDAKFLLPQPPDAPEFFLIPGDNQVTLVWQPSAAEKIGDPYFPLAADPRSALYDPNYRQFDVEGYRIYRGSDPSRLTLIAQVDQNQTRFVDFVGALDYGGQCAPELGITTDCPASFAAPPDTSARFERPLDDRIVQVPEGSRIIATTGALATLRADTFPTSEFPALLSNGVTYAFTDSTVRNSWRYYYAVTAFDFNSIRSGPSSFESPRFVKLVTPRASSGQEVAGQFATQILGTDGVALDTAAPVPAIDAATGIFAGPIPPTNAFRLSFSAFLPQLLGNGQLTVSIDSIQAGQAELEGFPPNPLFPDRRKPALYFLTSRGPTDTSRFVMPLMTDRYNRVPNHTSTVRFAAVVVDSAQAARFGAAPSTSVFGEVTLVGAGAHDVTSWGEANLFVFPRHGFNGPRWWTGSGNETTVNPNGGNCPTPTSSCGGTLRIPNVNLTAGQIPGITIFHPQAYSSVNGFPTEAMERVLATVTRAADFRVVWGSAGAIDTVFDETHHVAVPFRATIGASWGFLTQESFAGVIEALTRDQKNDLLTWSDLPCVAPLPEFLEPLFVSDTTRLACGGSAQIPAALRSVASLSPIAIRDSASSYRQTTDPGYTATGSGFVFYLNGHYFLMQMATLPAPGTVWRARFYSGRITGSAAQANFAFTEAIRPPPVPGLRGRITFQGSQLNRLTTTDSLLRLVHTVPDPFYLMSGYEVSPDTLQLKFVHLPALAIVRIYSQSGILVNALTNNDPTGGGELTWNLKSRSGKQVASGVYFYHVETADHKRRIGRFTIVSGKRNQ